LNEGAEISDVGGEHGELISAQWSDGSEAPLVEAHDRSG